jgi:hypothetical protein
MTPPMAPTPTTATRAIGPPDESYQPVRKTRLVTGWSGNLSMVTCRRAEVLREDFVEREDGWRAQIGTKVGEILGGRGSLLGEGAI